MQFCRLARNGISPPYFPAVPSSTRMKCEWLLSRHAPCDSRLEVMWYVTTPYVDNFNFILVSVWKHEQENNGLYALTLLSIKSVLWSTIPQVAMPIKCSCDSSSFNACAPRDMTVWPLTASPTWRITPVFVPPVIIHAPVDWAACGTSSSLKLVQLDNFLKRQLDN